MKGLIEPGKLAGIEYHGAGDTQSCIRAIVRLIQCDSVKSARLISHIDSSMGSHCFLLSMNDDSLIAIKSGFTSGYSGGGPTGLAVALRLLLNHGVTIEEYKVEREFIERINRSCLLLTDIDTLDNAHPVEPEQYYDYIAEVEAQKRPKVESALASAFPWVVPFRALDTRLFDLALILREQPDEALMRGYRRLEDNVRKRSGITGDGGVKLLSKVFQGDDPILYWSTNDPAESRGRALLFTGTFMAYRNRRSHSEQTLEHGIAYREFLLLNELFLLEASAIRRSEK